MGRARAGPFQQHPQDSCSHTLAPCWGTAGRQPCCCWYSFRVEVTICCCFFFSKLFFISFDFIHSSSSQISLHVLSLFQQQKQNKQKNGMSLGQSPYLGVVDQTQTHPMDFVWTCAFCLGFWFLFCFLFWSSVLLFCPILICFCLMLLF